MKSTDDVGRHELHNFSCIRSYQNDQIFVPLILMCKSDQTLETHVVASY